MFSKQQQRRVIPVLMSFVAVFFCLQTGCGSSQANEITITTITTSFSGNIYIGGAVNNPGLYPFGMEDSLGDLLSAAGGLQSGADVSQISLSIPDLSSASLPQRIDINRAEAWLLAALPGIGDTRASYIVAYREQNGHFRTISDLLKVEGFGQSTLDKIKDFVTISE